jgi:hypothetical protein
LKDRLITTIKVVISLGLMIYLFYWFLSDPERRVVLLTHIATANFSYLVLALLCLLIAIISNAVKWDILLRAQNIHVPLKALTHYTFVGQFFNNFLPANVGGDLMRGVGLAQYTERSAETAVSIIVDRIIGLLAFMFTAMLAALLAANIVPAAQTAEAKALGQILKQIELLTIIGMVLMLAGFAVILSHRLRQLAGKLFEIKLLQPLQPLYHLLSEAFGAYRYQYKALIWAFGVGVGTVLLTGLIDIAIVAGLHGQIDPLYIFLFNPIIAIALIAPISIGGLGTGSLLYVGLYGLVGAPAALVFALSLVKQAILYLGSLPGGLLWLQNRRKVRPNATPPDDVEAEPRPAKKLGPSHTQAEL